MQETISALLIAKLLSLLIYPLGLATLLAAGALVLSFTGRRRVSEAFLGFALIILYISSTPIFARWLDFQLEASVPVERLKALPKSDVVIVLGGPTLGRIVETWRVYHAGRARAILISGGHLPWESVAPEAQRIADILILFGAPRSSLILDTRSRTTRENALNVASIFRQKGWQTGLLVTSGYHMPRALAAFRKVGLDVVPATADLNAGSLGFSGVLDLVPSAWALAWTTSTMKEMIGFMVYRLFGWA